MDRTELSSGPLTKMLKEELSLSRFLIVMCSPSSAKPQRVDMRNRGQNTDSAKILEHIIYGLFFLYTWAPWLTRMYLSFAHTLDFVFEVLSAQHPFLVQGFTNCMDLPRIPRHAK
jgi:hypothetical protein